MINAHIKSVNYWESMVVFGQHLLRKVSNFRIQNVPRWGNCGSCITRNSISFFGILCKVSFLDNIVLLIFDDLLLLVLCRINDLMITEKENYEWKIIKTEEIEKKKGRGKKLDIFILNREIGLMNLVRFTAITILVTLKRFVTRP